MKMLHNILMTAVVAPCLVIPASFASANDDITVSTRRMSESEYRHTIRDIFGPEIEINARFEPEKREEGLMAIGNGILSLTSSGFEQYFNLASNIADQAFEKIDHNTLIGCAPKNKFAADATCAEQFITHYGKNLFRRPLSDEELTARLKTANDGANNTKDFNHGLKLALTSLLAAPEYLFRIEKAERDPANSKEMRLDAYTKVSRLSFAFWNTSPDAELVKLADSGDIHNAAVVEQQIQRLIASPKFKDGSRAFLVDMMQLDGFDNMVKDPAIYPKFNQLVADSAREQMIKTAIDLLVDKNRDYRELFSSNETFINRPLASIYNVPYPSAEEWTAYEFDEKSERAGILTQVGFLSLFAHPGTSSPTRRGIKLHEIFMCEPTPDPPADVDFSKVKDSMKGTVRGRLLDHMENTGCTSCHKRSDPPGLALEYFDGIGQLRKYENGVLIDVSAEFNGKQMVGAPGLANYLHDDERVPACLVRNVYAYGTGRKTDFWDEEYLELQSEKFAENGYRFPALMKQIAMTSEFFQVHVPDGVTLNNDADNKTAQLQR